MKNKFLIFHILILSLLPSLLYGSVYFRHLGKSEGLSQISVMSICQDEIGRMWFGTLEGLNCYDGNSMKVFQPSEYPILGNFIKDIVTDNSGNIFFNSDSKLIRYNYIKEQFYDLNKMPTFIHSNGKDVWISVNDSIFKWDKDAEEFTPTFTFRCKNEYQVIKCFYVDNNNVYWIGTVDGLYRVENIEASAAVCVIPDISIYSLYRDSRGRMWVAAFRDGMYRIENGISDKLDINSNFSLNSNDIRSFVEDDNGNIWVGTYEGLNKIDSLDNVISYNKDNIPGSLSHSSVYSLFKDKQGTIWVGTYYGGVNYFNPHTDIFNYYAVDSSRNDCLNYGYVGDMIEDKDGDLWICTEGGGLNYLNRKTGKFTYYLNNSTNSGSYFPNLKCIEYDRKRNCLYIGTHKQGLICFDINTKKIIARNILDVGSIINKIELRNDNLYILSSNGFFKLDLEKGTFSKPYKVSLGGLMFLMDSENYLWVSYFDKVVKINMLLPSQKEEYIYGNKGLGKFPVNRIVEDNKGTVFLGTAGSGVYEYDRHTDSFVHCKKIEIDYCYEMSISEDGYMAISNEKGVLLYQSDKKEIKIIDADRQLHISSVNDNCGLLFTDDDEIFVGGVEGMVSFKISDLSRQYPDYKLFISSLEINNALVSLDSHSEILTKVVPFTDKIFLKYNQNNLRFTFSSDDYAGGISSVIKEYRLDGFNEEWNICSDNNIIFTNLSPGKYKLQIREKNILDSEISHITTLDFVVRSPWWNTLWAYIIYILFLSFIVYELYKNWSTKMRLRNSLAFEKMEKEKQEELVQAKLRFFANVSHEFRTPLTLIVSEVEYLLSSSSLSPYMRTHLQKIYRNTINFKDLISELLDFRKIENGKLKLNVIKMDLVSFLRELSIEFNDSATLKNIDFSFKSVKDEIYCWADKRQLRKIFSNLLSNAFKYTPEKGKVEIVVDSDINDVIIKIVDTGIGIPKESIPFIFDRFYQVNSEQSSIGSGIGLALVKSLVELHHGKISVQSADGYGSIFTVSLPINNPFTSDDYVLLVSDTSPCKENAENHFVVYISLDDNSENDGIEMTVYENNSEEKARILIVEDNEEVLSILTELLSPFYNVIIAINGEDGLKKAYDEHPELILSDIMMPVMSGIDMCKRIKGCFELSHIPVILLTALSSDENKLDGIQCGADDYIEKPFNNKILLGKIANMLRNRALIKKKYNGSGSSENTETDIQPLALNVLDVKFMEKLNEIVKSHISDSEFDVNALASELALSRSSLYNKLKALSDMSPNEYILNIRLKHAEQLLSNRPELQITEISEMSGFGTPRHFRHCFKIKYGVSPQEYRNKL